MTSTKIKIRLPDGSQQSFVGREAWTLRHLVNAGRIGVTTIDHPAPLDTRPHTLAKYSVSATGFHSAPTSAKAFKTRTDVCRVRAGATTGLPESNDGVSILRGLSACLAGRIATQRMRYRINRTAVSSIGSSAIPIS